MPSPADEPVLLHADASLCAASWRGVFLEVWFAAGTLTHFRAAHESHLKCVRLHPGRKIAHLTVVHAFSISGLDAASMKVLEERNRATYAHTSRSATVMPATGFSASIIRSVMTGLVRLARPPYPNLVAASLDEGLAFVARPTETDAPPPPYTIEDLRRAYDALKPPPAAP